MLSKFLNRISSSSSRFCTRLDRAQGRSSISMLFVLSLLGVLSCTNSTPTVQNVGLLGSPTYLGKNVWQINILDLNQSVTVSGNCDPRASELEASLDGGSTWQKVSTFGSADTDCSDSNFSFSLSSSEFSSLGFSAFTSASKILRVRQILAGAGPTDAALVTLRYSAPFGPRPEGLRVVMGKVSKETDKYKLDLRAYARGAAR